MVPPDDPQLLSELEPGQHAVVRRVPDGDPALLRYLGEVGLIPEASFMVVDKAPFEGPLTLDLAGGLRAVARELAGRIRVEVMA